MLTKFRSDLARAHALAQKSLPPPQGADSGWLAGLLPSATFDYKRAAGDPWDNSVVRNGLKWKQDAFGDARQVVRRMKSDGKMEIVKPTHPLVELLKSRAVPGSSASLLQAGIDISLHCDGNAYLYRVPGALGNVVGYQYVPHYAIEPKLDKLTGMLLGYDFQGTPKFLPPEAIVHLRDGIDPRNPHKGLSRLGAVLREVCTVNEASTFAAALLRNSGVPSVIVSPDGDAVDLTPEQRKSFKEQWKERLTGDRRGEPFVQSIPVKVQFPGYSPEQLVLSKTQSIPTHVICGAMNLDPMVLGLPSDYKTYSNYREACEAAYEAHIRYLRALDEQLTHWCLPDSGGLPGDELGRDYSEVRALQEDMDKLYRRQTASVGGPWLTPNEAREKAGLPKIEGGDKLYPVKAAGSGSGDGFRDGDDDGATDDRNDPDDAVDAKKLRNMALARYRAVLKSQAH